MRFSESNRSVPSRLTILVLVWALLLSLFPSLAAERKRPAATPKWDVLYGCRLLRESHRDGDSFHVSVGRREYIFRLYFVDAPETDTSFLDRNREQCEYFGVSERELRKAAEAARQVTADLLQKPFVVTTRWQNAMGRSVLPRYYGMVEIGGKDLAAILVSRGLARAKGKTAILPNGESAKAHMENFRRLEAAAKIKRLGIWASSTKP